MPQVSILFLIIPLVSLLLYNVFLPLYSPRGFIFFLICGLCPLFCPIVRRTLYMQFSPSIAVRIFYPVPLVSICTLLIRLVRLHIISSCLLVSIYFILFSWIMIYIKTENILPYQNALFIRVSEAVRLAKSPNSAKHFIHQNQKHFYWSFPPIIKINFMLLL